MDRRQSINSDPSRSRSGSQSHRDPGKKFPETLSPKTSAHRPRPSGKAYNLIVCGAIYPDRDAWIFADFMAFCHLFRTEGGGGDFWNCLDVDKEFGHLSMESPPRTSIKFGVTQGTNKPMIEYTRFQHVARNSFFVQKDPDMLLTDIANWANAKQQIAVPGDVVNIIVECHGSVKGLHIGGRSSKHVLTPEHARKICSKFIQGVQINFATGACRSGIFTDYLKANPFQGKEFTYFTTASSSGGVAHGHVRSVSNRVRNGRFSQAFVQSLARVLVPGIPAYPDLTVRDHDDFMRKATRGSISGSWGAISVGDNEYQTFIAPASREAQLVEHMVFREKANFPPDPRVTSSRRRFEMPSVDVEIDVLNLLRSNAESVPQGVNPGQTLQAFHGIVAEEKGFYDETQLTSLGDDYGINEDFIFSDKINKRANLLTCLYLRGRTQMAIHDMFCTLVLRGLIASEALLQPVDFKKCTIQEHSMMHLLYCFEYLKELYTFDECGYIVDTEEPAIWLSIMIIRGMIAPPDAIFDTIRQSGFLGELNDEAYESFKTRSDITKTWDKNPNSAVGSPRKVANWGWWIPIGVLTKNPDVMAEAIIKGKQRFNRIESCYRDWFCLSKDQLLLEHEQADFFERNPTRDPCYRYSGSWSHSGPSKPSGNDPSKSSSHGSTSRTKPGQHSRDDSQGQSSNSPSNKRSSDANFSGGNPFGGN